MKTSTCKEKYEIHWTTLVQPDDSEFPDDLSLLSHAHQQMQVKMTTVVIASASISLNIHEYQLIKKLGKNAESG
ncbi:unnamed protein product [Schistosoma margrebowiei]|uniref:Uncharacterized protein n=1 Tax=Schistosoma margrebowiei TaxID=48269 RepID=A0A183MSL9_9TREM|nr:unnamed protein product [Schistosoma margrebowiei]